MENARDRHDWLGEWRAEVARGIVETEFTVDHKIGAASSNGRFPSPAPFWLEVGLRHMSSSPNRVKIRLASPIHHSPALPSNKPRPLTHSQAAHRYLSAAPKLIQFGLPVRVCAA